MLTQAVVFAFVIAVVLGAHAKSDSEPSGFERLPGRWLQIAAGDPYLWAVNRYYQIARTNGTTWETLRSQATQVAATDTGAWILNHFTDDPSKRAKVWDDKLNNFRSAAEANSIDLSYINGINGAIVGIGYGGCVKNYKEGPADGWTTDTNDCGNRLIAIGDQKDLWKIDQNDNLYRKDGGGWKQQQIDSKNKKFLHVDIEDPKRVVAVDDKGAVFTYDGSNWTPLPAGSAPIVQATINSKSVFVLDYLGNVLKKDL